MSAVTITDRDLISGAAKAIGLHWNRYDMHKLLMLGHSITADMLWNPLVNRAHALELGVTIEANIQWGDDENGRNVTCTAFCRKTFTWCCAVMPIGADATADLCRALTELAYDVAQAGGAA